MQATEALSREARDAIRRVLEKPLFELIPLKNVLDQVHHLPDGATVSVTASPAKGMDATLDLAEGLQDAGFDVIPHVSARLTADHDHLERIIDRLSARDMRRIFLVGGDATDPGEFYDGLSLLRAMEEIGHDLTSIGIPSYPEGHAVIPEAALDRALLDKQPYASQMTTQMCFSADAITSWTTRQRAAGVELPITLGMPGVADRLRLLKISARIGVGDSMRFLRKNAGIATRFVRPGSYNPAELLEDLGQCIDAADMNIVGVHIYTFNSCDATEAWRQEYLAALA
jgi:methylenetetrahydrofolate reductase (NADPH)